MGDNHSANAEGTNSSIDPAVVNDYAAKIEAVDARIATRKGECGADCKQLHREKKDLFKEASRAHGIKTKSLREALNDRAVERQRQERIAALEPDELAQYEEIKVQLGDYGTTPLGQHAIDAAKRGEALDSLRG
jgi:hypothetical protein